MLFCGKKMKKVVAYGCFNFSNNAAYLRMPEAFWGQSSEKRLEIVNQLIDELLKEKEHLELISQPYNPNI
jgi:hypothetical protein